MARNVNGRIEEDLKKLPKDPGVYLMHDDKGEIIYIGKAKNLKNRVTQYFQSGRVRSPKIEKMIGLISYFEYTITDSEVEALILENNLIKEHRPRYNTMLKDDKTYPYIKLTMSEAYPRLVMTRRIKRDRDKYYGPYPDAKAVHEIIALLNRIYKLRTCSQKLPKDGNPQRPCLNYHIGKCEAPCNGYISEEEYNKKIEEIRNFLDGRNTELLDKLKAQMMEASAAMEYEKAGEFKEMLLAAKAVLENQKMEYSPRDNKDILGLAEEGFDAIMQVFFVREGKLIGREHFYMTTAPGESEADIISSFIKQYYSGTPFLPSEILLPCETEDTEAVEDWLSQKAGHRVHIIIPQKGEKEKLLLLAAKNARLILDQSKEKVKREEMRTKGATEGLSEILGINYAKRIESYDISNISGVNSVGSMVVFEDGRPKKNDYRKFRIKTVVGPNDVGSMKEVLSRRLEHAEKYPDLILIDGGKGQVNAVLEALEQKKIDIPVCGMVKDDHHRTRGLLYNNREFEMDRSKEPFKLLTRIQDETHRFAIEYHRQLRGKEQTHSILDEIPDIGPKRRRAIMRTFKSIDAVKLATEEELAAVPEMNAKAAKSVYEFFRSN